MRKAISAAFAEYLWVIADADETSKNAFHLKKTGLEQAVSSGVVRKRSLCLQLGEQHSNRNTPNVIRAHSELK